MFQYLTKTVRQAYSSRLVRLYILIRFRIINRSILDAILNYTRPQGHLLVLGCGFGLFDLLTGLKYPTKPILGLDIDEKRIAAAREAAEKVGVRQNRFEVQDLRDGELSLPECDEILVLDILHHLPPDAQERLVRQSYEALRPGGRLMVKDIHRDNAFKLFFTWALDWLMTRGEPVYYRDKDSFQTLLKSSGFHVLTIYLNDILPYPHILFVCFKESDEDDRHE